MIPKAKVTQVGLKRGHGIYVVAGYASKLGYYPTHRCRSFRDYARAAKYALELQDYYQAPVVEF